MPAIAVDGEVGAPVPLRQRRLNERGVAWVKVSFDRSNALQARLHEMVPGGAHTFAKGRTGSSARCRSTPGSLRRFGR
jgi:hypothetical protein